MRRTREASIVANESGATIIFVAMAMVVMLSCIAMAVDTGMMMTARTESQRVADAAALAGAGSLVSQPKDSAAAHRTALDWTTRNDVRGLPVSVLDSDIRVDMQARTVDVTVHNSIARGNPIPTIFARVFGREEVDIVTTARAEAATAGSAACPLPIALPDRWIDDGDGDWEPYQDRYVSPPDPSHSGYGADDIGLRLQVARSQNANRNRRNVCDTLSATDVCNSHSSWNCWFQDSPFSRRRNRNTRDLRELIFPGCDGDLDPASVTDDIWGASNSVNEQSLIRNEFKNLVDADPYVQWDPAQGCVTRNGECTLESPRIRSVPLVSPDDVSSQGPNNSAPIQRFAGVFVEKVSCSPDMPHSAGPAGQWNVYLRLIGLPGWDPIGAPSGNPPLTAAPRLTR